MIKIIHYIVNDTDVHVNDALKPLYNKGILVTKSINNFYDIIKKEFDFLDSNIDKHFLSMVIIRDLLQSKFYIESESIHTNEIIDINNIFPFNTTNKPSFYHCILIYSNKKELHCSLQKVNFSSISTILFCKIDTKKRKILEIGPMYCCSKYFCKNCIESQILKSNKIIGKYETDIDSANMLKMEYSKLMMDYFSHFVTMRSSVFERKILIHNKTIEYTKLIPPQNYGCICKKII